MEDNRVGDSWHYSSRRGSWKAWKLERRGERDVSHACIVADER